MLLKAEFYDGRGNHVETVSGPVPAVVRRAATFIAIQGSDPEERGRAAQAGQVHFEPDGESVYDSWDEEVEELLDLLKEPRDDAPASSGVKVRLRVKATLLSPSGAAIVNLPMGATGELLNDPPGGDEGDEADAIFANALKHVVPAEAGYASIHRRVGDTIWFPRVQWDRAFVVYRPGEDGRSHSAFERGYVCEINADLIEIVG